MRVKAQILIPGMQYCHEARLHLSALALLGQFKERLGGRFEEHIVHGLLVVENQWVDLVGLGDHHVKVVDGKDVFQPILQPFCALQALTFRAIAVPARVV